MRGERALYTIAFTETVAHHTSTGSSGNRELLTEYVDQTGEWACVAPDSSLALAAFWRAKRNRVIKGWMFKPGAILVDAVVDVT